jgi:hypothetical protein
MIQDRQRVHRLPIAAGMTCAAHRIAIHGQNDETWGLGAWTGSWTGSPDNPSAVSAVSAITRAIGAASACAGRRHASRNA